MTAAYWTWDSLRAAGADGKHPGTDDTVTADNYFIDKPADRAWAAIQLAHTPGVCESILSGLLVRAADLDVFWLARALRGAKLPHPESYIPVTDHMLDAIVEAGHIPAAPGKRWKW